MQLFWSKCIWLWQVNNWKELHDHAQKYNAQLQQYNSKLQDDLQATSSGLRDAQVRHTSLWVCGMCTLWARRACDVGLSATGGLQLSGPHVHPACIPA